MAEVIGYAEAFARVLEEEFDSGIDGATLAAKLEEVGRRLAAAIVRPEVIELRRLLIGEAQRFPTLGATYYDRAPGQVLDTLAAAFERLGRAGLLRVLDTQRAAAQFAYLAAGELLDRAMLSGAVPPREAIVECAREGVETFLARYGPGE